MKAQHHICIVRAYVKPSPHFGLAGRSAVVLSIAASIYRLCLPRTKDQRVSHSAY
jgi:hypothetical protein